MCIGIPMQVISVDGRRARCEGMGETRQVDLSLIPDAEVGSWLLVFMDAAREQLSEEAANQIRQALQALNLAMANPNRVSSDALDHLFPDLADREPQLPPHLQALASEGKPVLKENS